MAVNFSWVPFPLNPGRYYARVIRQGTPHALDLVRAFAERSLIQPVDVRAVIDALRE